MNEELSLCYAFPDASPSFTHGFEAGRIAMCMQQGLTPIEDGMPVHEENAEVLRRMAEYYGYAIDFAEPRTKDSEGWLYMTAHKIVRTVSDVSAN